MTFPPAGAQVYYNEAGEPLGWDLPSFTHDEWDPEEYYGSGDEDRLTLSDREECIARGLHGQDGTGTDAQDEYTCLVCGETFLLDDEGNVTLRPEPETMHCVLCLNAEELDQYYLSITGLAEMPHLPERKILSTFTTNKQDPTIACRLECGHTVI